MGCCGCEKTHLRQPFFVNFTPFRISCNEVSAMDTQSSDDCRINVENAIKRQLNEVLYAEKLISREQYEYAKNALEHMDY